LSYSKRAKVFMIYLILRSK